MKSPLASRTVIFNLLALLIVIANGFGFADFAPDPSVALIGTGLVAGINLALRFRTKEGISLGE